MAHHVLDVTLKPENYTTPGDVTLEDRPPRQPRCVSRSFSASCSVRFIDHAVGRICVSGPGWLASGGGASGHLRGDRDRRTSRTGVGSDSGCRPARQVGSSVLQHPSQRYQRAGGDELRIHAAGSVPHGCRSWGESGRAISTGWDPHLGVAVLDDRSRLTDPRRPRVSAVFAYRRRADTVYHRV